MKTLKELKETRAKFKRTLGTPKAVENPIIKRGLENSIKKLDKQIDDLEAKADDKKEESHTPPPKKDTKKKVGRPKGSGSKTKTTKPKGKVGRPKGSGSKAKASKPIRETPLSQKPHSELTKEECLKLLSQYQTERKRAKTRATSRKEKGKPEDLTVAETVSNTAQTVKNKAKDQNVTGKQALSVKSSIDKIVRSVTDALKQQSEARQFLNELIKSLQKIQTQLKEGKYYSKGGRLALEDAYKHHLREQGYDDRLDEHLGGERSGKHSQSLKDRRDESKGEERALGNRPYSAVSTMDDDAKRKALDDIFESDYQGILDDDLYRNYAKGGEVRTDVTIRGNRIRTNEDLLESFLNSDTNASANKLTTHYNSEHNEQLLRHYGTLIALRKGMNLEVAKTYHSQTTTKILNQVKRLANAQGFNITVSNEFEKGGKTEDEDWVKGAVRKMKKKGTVGSFTALAKKHKMTTRAFMKDVLTHPDDYDEDVREKAQFMANVTGDKY